jgi:hypothetical protein
MSCFFRSFPPVVHFELDSTNSNLLWSHYANGHRGLAIELVIPGDLKDIEIIEVQYDDTMPQFEAPVDRSTLRNSLSINHLSGTMKKKFD